jgi:hypothetical protein
MSDPCRVNKSAGGTLVSHSVEVNMVAGEVTAEDLRVVSESDHHHHQRSARAYTHAPYVNVSL